MRDTTKNPEERMDQVSQIMAYEQDELSDEETVALFQDLINSGLCWKLQGHYGRTAMALINSGLCQRPMVGFPE